MGYHSLSLSLCMPVHNMVPAGERNSSLAAQSSTRGLSRERQSQRNPASLFPTEPQRPDSLTPTTSTPTQPAQRTGAEMRTLEGAGQSSVRTCGVGGYRRRICNLQNLLPQFPELCFHINWCFFLPYLLTVWSPTSSSPATDYPVSGAADLILSAACTTLMDTHRPAAWKRDSPMWKLGSLLPWRYITSIWLCGVARKVTWRMRYRPMKMPHAWPSM